MLVPEVSYKSAFAKAICKSIGQEVKLGRVPFKGKDRELWDNVSLFFFLTPDFVRYIQHVRKNKHVEMKNKDTSKDPGLKSKKGAD